MVRCADVRLQQATRACQDPMARLNCKQKQTKRAYSTHGEARLIPSAIAHTVTQGSEAHHFRSRAEAAAASAPPGATISAHVKLPPVAAATCTGCSAAVPPPAPAAACPGPRPAAPTQCRPAAGPGRGCRRGQAVQPRQHEGQRHDGKGTSANVFVARARLRWAALLPASQQQNSNQLITLTAASVCRTR